MAQIGAQIDRGKIGKDRLNLCVAVFSFNRGAWLSNALSSLSLLTNVIDDGAVQVHDDDSDDPETRAVLAALPAAMRRGEPMAGRERHGGLYARMQAALDAAPAGSLILFLQDDTQVVRALDATDIDTLTQAFSRHPDLAFVSASFIRGRRQRRFRRSFDAAGAGLFLSRRGRDGPRNCYSDVVIGHVDRLRAAGWCFAHSERANAEQAARLFGPMAVLATPFVAWLPEAPFFRHRKRPLVARLFSPRPPAAFHPLTADQVARLRARPPQEPALAEDWLRCTRPVRRPFVYKDVQASRISAALYALERSLRRLM